MSSYFHSAAMTLLSKTLQTLLYKYLSDVDVEGVALPSLYNTDGHSGWGVRLSNVKLREGVKLMDLPGRIPKKDNKHETEQANNEDTTKPPPDKVTTTGDDAFIAANQATPRNAPVDSPIGTTSHSLATGEGSSHHQTSAHGLETVVDNDSDGKESSETVAESQPPPLPQRSSSWFSWGGYHRSKSEEIPPPPTSANSAPVRATSAGPEDDLNSVQGLSVTEHVVSDPSSQPKQSNHHRRFASADDMGSSNHSMVSFNEEVATPVRRTAAATNYPTQTPKAESAAATENEPPMRLRLGKGGSIGILDVRLVGKALHVVVEDADLTIEAVVVKPASSSSTEKEESGKDKTPKVKPAKKTPDPETIGDRILAENKLAKIFSIIPNLFLRDIRIRLVLREETVDEPDKPTEFESPDDTVVELCIELLSVTDGQDFFAHVREEEEEESVQEVFDYHEENEAAQTVAPTINPEGQFTQNEYLTKRIRTGRGPDGGILLKIYPGEKYIDSQVTDPHWSRQAWYAFADWCVFRCSGLDVHARIFMGTMKELQIFSATDTWYGDTDVNEYTVDSMLLDYIAPGPQPPLPPMPENVPYETDEGQLWTLPGATTYRIDTNGIQSSFVNSSFHRVARGMVPRPCVQDHLPCEYCDQCWEAHPRTPLTHSYDMAAPLGGLVLNVMIRDPLEVNVDRPTLQIIGLLLKLFKKPEKPAGPVDPENEAPPSTSSHGTTENFEPKPLQRSVSLHSKDSYTSLDTAISPAVEAVKKTPMRSASAAGRLVEPMEDEADEKSAANKRDFGDISSAFPSYMSPEKVQYAGVYVQQIIFRVHMMKENLSRERGFGFCFWQLLAKCLTIDQHCLLGDTTPFKDVRMDCGFLTVTSFQGNEQRLLVSLGVRQRVVEFDEATVETLMTRGDDCQRPPWPTTATVLLDIPPPLESLVFESRERHAFQLRFVSVADPNHNKSRSSAHLKLGSANVSMPYASIREISAVIREARATVLSQPNMPPTEREPAPAVTGSSEDRLMKYRLQLDGARVLLEPLVDARLPMCTFRGDRASLTGLFLETVLDRIQVRYGRQHEPTVMDNKRISLERLARLPEQLRMRILLCLDDLNPLARALGMRSEENSFLRCRSINKRIVRVANKKKKRPTLRLDEQISRRQFLMQELMKLDDDELEDLYESHMRRQRRFARSQNNS